MRRVYGELVFKGPIEFVLKVKEVFEEIVRFF